LRSEGDMANLQQIFKQLKKEQKRAQKEVRELEAALTAFGKLVGKQAAKTQRQLSAAARKRISAAQKARWAKLRGR
jgi:uncharacterized protein (DUF3084 family)